MRIVTVVGPRPQFIKAAALSRAISTMGGAIQEQILHTGQYYDAAVSDQFFAELGTPAPAFHPETEWVELIECGWNRRREPSDTHGILNALQQQLAIDINHPRPQLYGDGNDPDEMLASLRLMVETPGDI